MISLLISVLLAWMPLAQEGKDIPFDIRARQNLLMGKGGTSGSLYYDVVITRQPTQGILIKLPYTKKGGKFSFDLHHCRHDQCRRQIRRDHHQSQSRRNR